jgi:transcriptional regulator with XRE-family HTH domain
MEQFGKKLKILRRTKGLTLKELAKELGYESHSYLSELESGKKYPTIDLVISLSRYFLVTTDQLLKDEFELENLED